MLTVPKIQTLDSCRMAETSELLDNATIIEIGCNNWPGAFPYTPGVSCNIAHNGQELFLKFRVSEQYTIALITGDNDTVCTDSCVEFFISADESGYYNFEFSCIGKTLLGFRKTRPEATYAPPEILETIKRFPSLGYENFEEQQENTPWELTVAIPATALFRHRLNKWSGLKATANFYKCGDHLSLRHYLSWQPIQAPKPDFHTPAYFSAIEFAGK